MNNLFKTEIYIHMIIVFVLMLYALTTSIYILFNDTILLQQLVFQFFFKT